ncbi:MAG: DUF1428 domain-containing protein [Opitutaceae bacterium]
MPNYTDGFVVPVPKKRVKEYITMAKKAAKIWKEYGALDYKECLGDDLEATFAMPFPKGIRLKSTETVVFSWIVYKSKAHRDSVNKKIMTDPRMEKMCDPKNPPFDCKRMLYGGFKVVVSN